MYALVQLLHTICASHGRNPCAHELAHEEASIILIIGMRKSYASAAPSEKNYIGFGLMHALGRCINFETQSKYSAIHQYEKLVNFLAIRDIFCLNTVLYFI